MNHCSVIYIIYSSNSVVKTENWDLLSSITKPSLERKPDCIYILASLPLDFPAITDYYTFKGTLADII